MKAQILKEVPLHSMTADQLKSRLLTFAARAKFLSGTTLVLDDNGNAKRENGQYCSAPIGQAVAEFFTNMANNLTDPKALAARNQFMSEVEKSPEARKQFCALRLETYNNYLLADMRWMEYFFEIVTLGDDERPMVQNDYEKEVKIYYVGQDGRPKSMKLEFTATESALPLRVMTSPKMRYKVNDLYRGNIVKQAVQSLTLSRDMTNKMEAECKALYLSMIGSFTFTGAKANWPYVSNSYINTDNLPSTNDVDVQQANGYFDYPVLDEIINYAKLINGVRLPNMGEFRPTGRIRVPSTHIRYFGTFAPGSSTPHSATPAAAAPSAAQEQIYDDGWGSVNYKKIQWIFEPDATLDPAVKTCFPEFTIKPGRVFLKPSQDREVVRTGDQDYQLFQDNEEERWMKKVFSAYGNSATRIFAAQFNYDA